MLDQLCRTDAVNICHYHIVVIHALRPVLLRQKHISKGLRKNLAQLVMQLQVHSKITPHFPIVCHFIFLLCLTL